jgi:hypothetical protein
MPAQRYYVLLKKAVGQSAFTPLYFFAYPALIGAEHEALLSLHNSHTYTSSVKSKSKSKSLRWKSPACIKERLSTSAHTSQSPTEKRKRETTETIEDLAGCQPCNPACA